MLQHYPSPQGNGTVLLCQSVQQLRRLLPAYYWLGCFLFNFKIFRSKTTEKNLALSPLTRFLQVCDHWLFNSTTFLQLLPKTRLMNRCVDEGEISPLSKVAVHPRVIKSGAAMDEEFVEELEAVKDSAANASWRPGPRRGASADATELCLRRGASPDADETTPSLVPKIEVPIRRNWIEGATFAQSIWNRSSIAAAGIAAAASMTINTREGILDRDPLRTSRGGAAEPQARG